MYGNAPRRAFASTLSDLGASGTTINVALLTSSYTPDLSAHEVFGDVNGNEVTEANSTGYTAGGQAVANKSLSETGGITSFDGDNVTWAGSTITASYAVLYEDTGDASTSSVITMIDFEGQESSEDGDFTIEWDDAGVFEIDAS